MNIEELGRLAARLATVPVPTVEKKLYACLGSWQSLRAALPAGLVVEGSVCDAFDGGEIPEADETLRGLLPQRLSAHIAELRQGRATSLVLLRDAALLYRYRVPLTFLYDLVGDAHAIVLQQSWQPGKPSQAFPQYIKFAPQDITRFFASSLGPNCFTL